MKLINPCNTGGSSTAGFLASDVPYFQQVQSVPTDTADTAIASSGVIYQIVPATTSCPTELNNDFEQYANGSVRYIGTEPVFMLSNPQLYGRILGAAAITTIFYLRRNGAVVTGGARGTVTGASTADVANVDMSCLIKLQQYDVISTGVNNTTNTQSYRCVGFANTGTFGGYLTEAQIVGSELFANPTISSTTGFGGEVNCSLSASGGELTATATGAGAATFTASLSGLNGSAKGRLIVGAKRGGSGTGQEITSTTFGTITATSIDTTSEDFYVFDINETGSSGTVTFTIDASASGGESLIITSLSFKEYV